ncbi:PriCT-2 domain-containing protein, partial [bacterium]|nr:PriCT-2 domain-containing protein [bacterium]
DERKILKQKLPAIMFGGKFKNRRDLEESSNIICIDFDHVENISRYAFRLPFYSFVYGFFYSPSGDGLKVLVRANVEDNTSYKKVIKEIMESFKEIGLIADSSKQSINDLCYLSHDPNAYFNPKATIWRNIQYQIPEETNWSELQIKESVGYIIEQIEEQEIDITPTYDKWVRICFALNDQFGEEGREYFHKISQFYKGFNEASCDKQYDYCSASAGDGITIRTLFKIAKEFDLKLTNAEIVSPDKLDPFDQEFYTGEELLLRKVSQLPTLLDPILPQVGLVALGGSSDVGKSTFLRHLAINISSGEEKFIGFPINAKHNRVIYVSTEDDDYAVSYLIHKHNDTLNKPS